MPYIAHPTPDSVVIYEGPGGWCVTDIRTDAHLTATDWSRDGVPIRHSFMVGDASEFLSEADARAAYDRYSAAETRSIRDRIQDALPVGCAPV